MRHFCAIFCLKKLACRSLFTFLMYVLAQWCSSRSQADPLQKDGNQGLKFSSKKHSQWLLLCQHRLHQPLIVTMSFNCCQDVWSIYSHDIKNSSQTKIWSPRNCRLFIPSMLNIQCAIKPSLKIKEDLSFQVLLMLSLLLLLSPLIAFHPLDVLISNFKTFLETNSGKICLD